MSAIGPKRTSSNPRRLWRIDVADAVTRLLLHAIIRKHVSTPPSARRASAAAFYIRQHLVSLKAIDRQHTCGDRGNRHRAYRNNRRAGWSHRHTDAIVTGRSPRLNYRRCTYSAVFPAVPRTKSAVFIRNQCREFSVAFLRRLAQSLFSARVPIAPDSRPFEFSMLYPIRQIRDV